MRQFHRPHTFGVPGFVLSTALAAAFLAGATHTPLAFLLTDVVEDGGRLGARNGTRSGCRSQRLARIK